MQNTSQCNISLPVWRGFKAAILDINLNPSVGVQGVLMGECSVERQRQRKTDLWWISSYSGRTSGKESCLETSESKEGQLKNRAWEEGQTMLEHLTATNEGTWKSLWVLTAGQFAWISFEGKGKIWSINRQKRVGSAGWSSGWCAKIIKQQLSTTQHKTPSLRVAKVLGVKGPSFSSPDILLWLRNRW